MNLVNTEIVGLVPDTSDSKAMPAGKDRRMEKRASLTDIVNAMQLEADARYEGQLENNALTIFNLLTTSEKRTFLRFSVLAIKNIQNSSTPTPQGRDAKEHAIESVDQEREALVTFNKQEHDKFVNFLTRLLFVVLLVIFAAFAVFAIMYGNDNAVADVMKKLEEILTILVKLG